MKAFLAGLCHETSAFSPTPTSRRSFEEFVWYRPVDGRPSSTARALNGFRGFLEAADAHGDEAFVSSYSWAQPSAPCRQEDYESLRDEILDDLRIAGPVDMVLLFLHGAQMAQACDDCEGDLLSAIRSVVGEHVFVGALLDLHANVTEAMIDAADALLACRNYPHTDFDERAGELYALGRRAALGEVRPQMRFERLQMIGMFYTTEPKMAAANAVARALEGQDGALAVSLIHGFLWADMAQMGAGALLVRDGERPSLDHGLRHVAKAFFDARGETRALRKSVEEVLDIIAMAPPHDKPFVVADACDNAGGGAGSDSTFILDAVLTRGLQGFAFGLLWDPVAVQFAQMAGEGGALRLRLGGKTGPEAGRPLDVKAKVLALKSDVSQQGIGFTAPVGAAAALEIEGNIVIVNDVRGQVFSPSCFHDLGVDVAAQRAVVVKSTQHFHAQFEPLAQAILYCETQGALALDIDPDRFRNLRRPMWPLDEVDYAP